MFVVRAIVLLLSLALTTAGARQPSEESPARTGGPHAAAVVDPPAPPAAPAPGPQRDPAEQARLQRQDEEMGRAALRVATLVDEGRSAEVWDGASRVARDNVAREAFVRQLAADRQKLGALQAREQVAVTRATYAAGGQVPEGTYISVVFSTRFQDVGEPVRELVSFRLDEDRSWRVAGYSLR